MRHLSEEDLDRDYEAVLNYVHKVQEVSGDIDDFDLYDVCEADEVYVTAGEKGVEDEDGSPRGVVCVRNEYWPECVPANSPLSFDLLPYATVAVELRYIQTLR